MSLQLQLLPARSPSSKSHPFARPHKTPTKCQIVSPTTKGPTEQPPTVTVAPTVAGCVNNNSIFNFTLVSNATITEDCAWITKKTNAIAIRTDIYCGIGEIKYMGCPSTYNGCGTCSDDATYQFKLKYQPESFKETKLALTAQLLLAWSVLNHVATVNR